MFTVLGHLIYRARYVTIIGFVVAMGLSGLFGLGYEKLFTQGGFYDDSSESVAGARLADATFGRNTRQDVIALYTAPPGKRLDDPDIAAAARKTYARLLNRHSAQVRDPQGFWDSPTASGLFGDSRCRHGFVSIGLRGATDTDRLHNYHLIENELAVPGIRLQLAGMLPLSAALAEGMASDTRRAELIALPLVALGLLVVFGGVVAATLPVLVGGLTILGSTGILRLVMHFTAINAFASAVITLIGLGLAIDYGLFTVSRFREELDLGSGIEAAVVATIAGAGRAVTVSATVILVCLGSLAIFPMVFLRSLAFAAICAVILAALLSVTLLPAVLAVLGQRVDALGLRRLRGIRPPADTEASMWSKMAGWACDRPLRTAIPIILLLAALIAPCVGVQFGGLSEKYLSPDNPARTAQQDFDTRFPGRRTTPLELVVVGADNTVLSAIGAVADRTPGLTGRFQPDQPRTHGVDELSAGLRDKDADSDRALARLRSIRLPPGVRMYVTGTPALERDAIHGLLYRLPALSAVLTVASFVLMFLAFGSFVLPVKAIVMSGLSLTATLGFLALLFYHGVGASVLDFTPGPLMFAVLVVIVALVFGLSTDYEIFLMSRMVEARDRGESTRECIRSGTARTGNVITAAAAILIVVSGAFAFSDIAMMQYLAYGMIAALLLDATVIRMLLVPAVLMLFGEYGWWAPHWARQLRRRLGFE